ncbi:uncharacterized protein LOC115216535 [Octopus sinensis]|uniref:Uncharacterized protein LOC115216535 n=1 Tax=Octopus sinensis TaxID=2607531 RepID=A0A6P7SUH3_9MOLL|nr:uncharacterized protein LOC115216535 [Octopus sinensis]
MFRMAPALPKRKNIPGRPATGVTIGNVEKINQLVHKDRQRTINDIADVGDLSCGPVQAILTSELNTRHASAMFVPRLLTTEQKEHGAKVCQDLRQRVADDPSFLSSIITGDENGVYGYDPHTKQQSSQWKRPSSPRPEQGLQSRSSGKPMLIFFMDIHSIVHREFVFQGPAVNREFYCDMVSVGNYHYINSSKSF